jgi:hypothetical protein
MAFPLNTRTLADVDNWWQDETTAVLLEALYHQGHSFARMAELLGAPSSHAVQYRARQLGLQKSHPRNPETLEARNRTRAERRAETVPAGWPKQKQCLRCRKTFASDGPHNHVCPSCSSTNNATSLGLGGMYMD